MPRRLEATQSMEAQEASMQAAPAVRDASASGRRGLIVLAAWALVALLFAGQAWLAAQVRGEPWPGRVRARSGWPGQRPGQR